MMGENTRSNAYINNTDKKTYKFRRSHIKIAKSTIPDAGNGVFAQVDIPKGKFLAYYIGELITEKEFQKLADTSYIFAIETVKTINKNKKPIDRIFYIDATNIKTSNWTRYVNGAKTPKQEKMINIESKQKGLNICYYTTKDIKKGSELIMSYGDEYWINE
jgi:uncharacterized protein